MLIRNAEIFGRPHADVRISRKVISEIGTLTPLRGEDVIDAGGACLLPGLHDHHLHLASFAARQSSIACGPPDVTNAEQLAQALETHEGSGWIRGVNYHESVMGMPGAADIDAIIPTRPVRIQHRSGRMWFFNNMALDILLNGAPPPPGLERVNSHYTGRLFDSDDWLRRRLAGSPPGFSVVSAQLARFGVTGITDMTPNNDGPMMAHFGNEIESGALLQNVVMAGGLSLGASKTITTGPVKLHLHEAALPDFDDTLQFLTTAHDSSRPVAIHCVTEVELVYALALIEAGGAIPGDRIEHASVAPDHLVDRMAALGLAICVQPHFIYERGDQYLTDVEEALHPLLYRLQSLRQAGLTLIGGSDAPLASHDPWAAMRAATQRQTRSGAFIGKQEALSPEAALALYLADPCNPAQTRTITVGAPADLCLMTKPWEAFRKTLNSDSVRATFILGRKVFDSVNQPPIKGVAGGNTLT